MPEFVSDYAPAASFAVLVIWLTFDFVGKMQAKKNGNHSEKPNSSGIENGGVLTKSLVRNVEGIRQKVDDMSVAQAVQGTKLDVIQTQVGALREESGEVWRKLEKHSDAIKAVEIETARR